jgi:tRNA/rRNA methyltransferase
MSTLLDNVRIVLVRTSKAGNIGAVARAMANMEMSDLWLAAPRCDHLSHESRRRSTKGEPILHAARVVSELPEALQGVTYTVAASCRGGVYREQIEMSPRQAAEELRSRAGSGGVALVFGPEDSGLRSDEVLACDAVVRIPSNPAYPSLNVAQAVMVCAYEVYVAAGAEREAAAGATGHPTGAAAGRTFLGAGAARPADAVTMHQLMKKLESALLRIGYLRPEHPEHLLFPIRAILGRAGLSQTEAQILIGLAQQIQEYSDGMMNDE